MCVTCLQTKHSFSTGATPRKQFLKVMYIHGDVGAKWQIFLQDDTCLKILILGEARLFNVEKCLEQR